MELWVFVFVSNEPVFEMMLVVQMQSRRRLSVASIDFIAQDLYFISKVTGIWQQDRFSSRLSCIEVVLIVGASGRGTSIMMLVEVICAVGTGRESRYRCARVESK